MTDTEQKTYTPRELVERLSEIAGPGNTSGVWLADFKDGAPSYSMLDSGGRLHYWSPLTNIADLVDAIRKTLEEPERATEFIDHLEDNWGTVEHVTKDKASNVTQLKIENALRDDVQKRWVKCEDIDHAVGLAIGMLLATAHDLTPLATAVVRAWEDSDD